MSINYPTSLDTLTNPSSTDKLNSPSHSEQHGDGNDAIEAIQTKVGIDSSAVTTSIDYKLTNTSSSNPGHKHTLADGATDITASKDELNIMDGVTASTEEINKLDGITASTAELNKTDGISGNIVGTTDTQTLTNKTIAYGSNTLTAIGKLYNIQTYTSGSGTYTVPSGVTMLRIIAQGGGGGGGGFDGDDGTGAGVGTGGCSGGYCEILITSPSASYAYAVGSGGAAGSDSGGTGGTGGNTTIAGMTAGGGGGGTGCTAKSTSGFGTVGTAGGASGGDINIVGQRGTRGQWNSSIVVCGGIGASSQLGRGGSYTYDTGAQSLKDAAGYGAGGGSTGGNGTSSGRTGGAGKGGIIIIYEFK